MPIVTSGWYTEDLVAEHSDWIFLFGDNARRFGRIGQALICRERPNCVGIRTKWLPNTRPGAFFSDADYDRCVAMIDEDLAGPLAALAKGATIVLPMGGIGTGYAHLEDRAPNVFAYLMASLKALVAAAVRHPPVPTERISAPRAKNIQEAARMAHIVLIWNIYRGTEDFPGYFVAVPSASTCFTSMLECLVDEALSELRKRRPSGLIPVGRRPERSRDISSPLADLPPEPANLVESWLP